MLVGEIKNIRSWRPFIRFPIMAWYPTRALVVLWPSGFYHKPLNAYAFGLDKFRVLVPDPLTRFEEMH